MAITNITQVANSTGFVDFLQNTNTILLSDSLGILILFAVGIISFMSFHQSTLDVPRSIVATAFICTVLSTVMLLMGIVPSLAVWISLIVWAGSIGFLWRE